MMLTASTETTVVDQLGEWLEANRSLTPEQRSERAVQWLIHLASITEFCDQPLALIKAMARVAQSRNGGRPLSKTAADQYVRLFKEALTGAAHSPEALRYIELEAENIELRRQLRYIADSMADFIDDGIKTGMGDRIAANCQGGSGFIHLYKQIMQTAKEFAAERN